MPEATRRTSFRTLAAVVVGGVAVAVLALLSAGHTLLLVRQIEQDRGAVLQGLASSMAQGLDAGLRERLRQVEYLAGAGELWRQGLATPDVGHALQRLKAGQPFAAWVGVADVHGVVQAAADGVLRGQSVQERPWFAAGRQAPYVGDVHPARLLEAILPKGPRGEPLRLVDFAAPIVVDGRLLGVVGVHGNWNWARSVVESLLPADAQADQLGVVIVGRGGHVLFASDNTSTPQPTGPAGAALAAVPPWQRMGSGPAELRWPDGQTYLTASAPLAHDSPAKALGWQVLVRQPTRMAYADAREGGALAAALGLLGAAVAALAAWLMAGRLSRPLADLAHAAQQVGRGAPLAAPAHLGRSRELALLFNALQAMTQRLTQDNETLERHVADRTQALQQANVSLQQLSAEQHAMLDNEIVGMVRLQGEVVVWRNRALERMFGYGPDELMQGSIHQLHPDTDTSRQLAVQAARQLARGEPVRLQTQLQCKNGDLLWVDLFGTVLPGQPGQSLWLVTDINGLKEHQAQVEHIAFHDALTGLPNRLLLADRMAQAIALDERLHRQLAVCYLDLDGFKAVNDGHGHEAGDHLLRVVAQRLRSCMRASDTVARLGGDEFVLLLSPLETEAECQPVLQRVVDAVQQPITLPGGLQAQVSASVGVALSPRHGTQASVLLNRADEAMYEAKRGGKNQVRYFGAAIEPWRVAPPAA